MKPDEEIMAEYLLKGGKMLSKTCPKCVSPLFEYHGEELCVVCRERGQENGMAKAKPTHHVPEENQAPKNLREQANNEYPTQSLTCEIESTICCLCKRVQEEPRPEDCRILMECIKIGMDTLRDLYD